MRVLGIDLASSWRNLGAALVTFDEAGRVREVVPGALRWPVAPFTPRALADAINRFAREQGVSAVALDGPQGWRDPATDPALPGVGRRCELAARTPGKVGVRPKTWPGNQRPWIEHCIDTFASLLEREGVVLADAIATSIPQGGYLVAECFPTSAWRTSDLTPLPAKARRPDLASYYASLAARFDLPSISVTSHDDLQAIVAALTAAAAAGVPSIEPVARGRPSRTVVDRDGRTVRVEGFIWDARPARASGPGAASGGVIRASRADRAPKVLGGASGPRVHVTRAVVTLTSRNGVRAHRIELQGFPSASPRSRVRVRFSVAGHVFVLVVGDPHTAWWSHQDNLLSRESFEALFAMLADAPDQKELVSDLVVMG